MRVLVTGLNQSNFLIQLYSSIKQQHAGLHIAATSLRRHGDNQKIASSTAFDKIYTNKPSFFFKILSFPGLLFSRWFISALVYILFVQKNLKKALHLCYASTTEKAFFASNGSFKQYDVFHFHYLQYSYIRGIWMVPAGKKIICSFWGSDLLRTADNFNHFIVKKALEKATIITVQSNELKEIVLIKYGRGFKDKIRVVQFSLDENTFTLIYKYRGNQALINQFCKDNNISITKTRIVIGHNASNFNNHIAIIRALGMVEDKRNIFVIIPFAYGIAPKNKEAYKKQVIDELNIAGVQFTILDNYLNGENLALLRVVSDVMVHMPETDALSAALTETAYAGNIIIAGNWLPYSPFKKAGLQVEYTDFENLTDTFTRVITNYKSLQQEASPVNAVAVKQYFFPSKTAEGWLDIFNELGKP